MAAEKLDAAREKQYKKSNNYYNTKMRAKNRPLESSQTQNMPIPTQKTCKPRQELIVQIKIGKQSVAKQIGLSDINNMNYIDHEIKCLIRSQRLKESAFGYIKDIIIKQIAERKQQIYNRSHSKCSRHCKCHQKMHHFQVKQNQIFSAISPDTTPTPQSKSLQPKIKTVPQHLTIKISSNANGTPAAASISDFPRLSPLDKSDPNNLPNQQSQIRPNPPHIQEKQVICGSTRDDLSAKNPETLNTSLSKSRPHEGKYTIFKTEGNLTSSMIDSEQICHRKNKPISTRQRKEAIMSTHGTKLCHSKTWDLIVRSSGGSLRASLTEQNSRIIQKILDAPLFPSKCVPVPFEGIIASLFTKLTERNPPEMKELHSQYVSYQGLEREQLQLMGVLFEKINHHELNHLNYNNFRSNALKYCWKELEELVRLQSPP